MGLNVTQLRELVVRPALEHIGLWSLSAERLVIGTALVESLGVYLAQIRGPAKGLWQMEPFTHKDIWDNWLEYRHELAEKVASLKATCSHDQPKIDDLVGNLFYGAAMCRVFYRRLPDALPHHDDYVGMAKLWKLRYNTHLGKGTVEKAIPYFKDATLQ